MAVDLSDLIDSLKREVNSPGSDAFPDATDDDYLGYLEDAFWEGRLDGITALGSFDDADGILSNSTAGGAEITRDLQQLIVLYAGIRILRNMLVHLNTTFRAEAGPVQFETGRSVQLLKAIIDELQLRRNVVLRRLSDLGFVASYVIDSIVARDYSIGYGDTYWVNY